MYCVFHLHGKEVVLIRLPKHKYRAFISVCHELRNPVPNPLEGFVAPHCLQHQQGKNKLDPQTPKDSPPSNLDWADISKE